ncbi:MAG: MATE family efflux transporter [Armatimonadetes bacterium]|nr:MATE family efflux transporter [Armatimonadota bacterium]
MIQSPALEIENLPKTILSLAWPAVVLNSLQVINTLLDRSFIGHLPESALKGLGGAMSIQFLMFSLAFSLSVASTALVSRAYGAGDVAQYQKSARQCLALAVFVGIALALIGVLITPFLSRMFFPTNLGAQQEMGSYLHPYLFGLPAIAIIQTLAGALRGIGDTKSPMYISGIQILLHICLNILLIFPTRSINGTTVYGAGMGLAGASTALAISAWVAALGYLIFAQKTELGHGAKFELPVGEWPRRISRLAAPTAGMSILRVLSLSTFTWILTRVPRSEEAIAALPVAFAIESIMFMPAFGLSMAATSLVGQCLGAREPARAEKIGWLTSHFGAVIILLMVLPIYINANLIGRTMVTPDSISSGHTITVQQQKLQDNKELIANESTSLIKILCVTEVFFGYAMILIGAMQGAGDTATPLWITIISLWFLRVPGAYLLAVTFKMGPPGAYWAMSLSQMVQGLLAIWAFRRGHWKTAKV